MTLYLIKITINLIVFYLLYKYILEGNKTHTFKRFYLLLAPIISIVLPLINIKSNSDIVLYSNKIEEIVIANNSVITNVELTNTFPWQTVLICIYISGVIFSLFRFAKVIHNFHRMINRSKIEKEGNIKFVSLDGITSSFTFWNYIFISLEVPIDYRDKIIQHELIHARQRHTFDILYIELLKCIFWFHPLFYYYKTAMTLNHEFLADENVAKQTPDADEYLTLLLHQTYKQNEYPLSSSFNFNLTKKRFIMITKKNNPLQNAIGIIATFIALIGISTLSMTAQEKENDDNEIYTHVEKQAHFPEGIEIFNKYLIDEVAKQKVFAHILEDEAKMVLSFVVEKDGTIRDIKIIQGIDDKTSNQMIDIYKNSPKWIPAENNGKIVRSQFVTPIQIKLDKKNTES